MKETLINNFIFSNSNLFIVLEILCWIFIFIILIFLAYAWDKPKNK